MYVHSFVYTIIKNKRVKIYMKYFLEKNLNIYVFILFFYYVSKQLDLQDVYQSEMKNISIKTTLFHFYYYIFIFLFYFLFSMYLTILHGCFWHSWKSFVAFNLRIISFFHFKYYHDIFEWCRAKRKAWIYL